MWEPWLKALELNGVEFERLVRGATMAAVLKTPAAEDFPLSEVIQNPDAKVIGSFGFAVATEAEAKARQA